MRTVAKACLSGGVLRVKRLKINLADWDACAVDAAGGPGSHNPFLSHGFLRCLEESRSAVKVRPWLLSRLIPSQELPGTPHGAGAGPGAAALRIDGAALP